MTEPEATEAPATGRGRPRPSATIERDEAVLKYISANPGQTRAKIAEGTEIKGSEVYLSLYRLSRANPPQVVKTGATWSVPDAEAPAAEPASA